MPPMPSTASRRHLPLSTAPTRACARSPISSLTVIASSSQTTEPSISDSTGAKKNPYARAPPNGSQANGEAIYSQSFSDDQSCETETNLNKANGTHFGLQSSPANLGYGGKNARLPSVVRVSNRSDSEG